MHSQDSIGCVRQRTTAGKLGARRHALEQDFAQLQGCSAKGRVRWGTCRPRRTLRRVARSCEVEPLRQFVPQAHASQHARVEEKEKGTLFVDPGFNKREPANPLDRQFHRDLGDSGFDWAQLCRSVLCPLS